MLSRNRRWNDPDRYGIVYCLLCHLLTSSIAFAGEPPLIQDGYQKVIRAQPTELVKLICPVQAGESSSDLIFDWTKDGEPITAEWIRFRQTGTQLRIEEAEVQDSGRYVCRAVNGYGHQEADMRLKVRDPSVATGAETDSDDDDDDDNPDGTDVSLVPVEEFDSLPIEGLNFTEDTVRQPRYLRITTGTSLDLHCSASGYPAPHLVWLKDGRDYVGRGPSLLEDPDGWRSVSRLSLEIRLARPESAGNYTCLARGIRQKIEVTFTVQVLDVKKKLRHMNNVQPSNMTEIRGGKARFHCWLSSSSPPHVEWLKMLPPAPYRGQINTNTSLIIGDDQYQTLGGAEELVRKQDGSYLKTLILDPLHESDAGAYLCLGINSSGFNMEKAFLNIKLNYDNRETKSVPLSIMVALPSALILSIAGGFVCWIRERDRERRQELSAAAIAAASTVRPAPPSGLYHHHHHPPPRPALMTGSSHHPMEETGELMSGGGNKQVVLSSDRASNKRTGRVSVSTTASTATASTQPSTNHYYEPPAHHQQQCNTSLV